MNLETHAIEKFREVEIAHLEKEKTEAAERLEEARRVEDERLKANVDKFREEVEKRAKAEAEINRREKLKNVRLKRKPNQKAKGRWKLKKRLSNKNLTRSVLRLRKKLVLKQRRNLQRSKRPKP